MEYVILSASLDTGVIVYFCSPLRFSLFMQSIKESQRASLGTSVSVQTHPILVHVREPSQINRAISLTLKHEHQT